MHWARLSACPQELDEITLHNLALVDMDSNPTAGFAKLQFLLQARSRFHLLPLLSARSSRELDPSRPLTRVTPRRPRPDGRPREPPRTRSPRRPPRRPSQTSSSSTANSDTWTLPARPPPRTPCAVCAPIRRPRRRKAPTLEPSPLSSLSLFLQRG